MMRQILEQEVRKALQEICAGEVVFTVEFPPETTNADYATNAALVAARQLDRSPREIAIELQKLLADANIVHVERMEIAGAGFINFTLQRQFFTSTVANAIMEGKDWGSSMYKDGMRIMVEHTQPNPFKPFHIGHLMSNTIGESISRLMKNAGAEVSVVNYQGDVGLHVAKTLWGIQQKKLDIHDVAQIGEAYVFGNEQYEHDESAKREIIELNKRIYDHDPGLMELYRTGREISLKHFDELYRLLGSTFEHYFFEGEVWKEGVEAVREGLSKGIFEESDGAVVYRGEKDGLHTRVFLTSDGLPTYEAKEIGLAIAKTEYKSFDLSITTTAVEQQEYFKVVFMALGHLRPDLRGKFMHIAHGMMLLPSGKMSSRKGNVITGESLLKDMIVAAKEKMGNREVRNSEKVAQQVAVGAIKYAILKQTTGKNIVFDEGKSLSMEGDSGPYLQYAHTRCCSILSKAKEEGVAADTEHPSETITLPEQLLARFPEVAQRAAEEFEPHHVAQYLTELASAFNAWYAKERILDQTPQAPYKLAVVDAVRQTISNGLDLLGVEAPREM